jgi:integrase
MDDYDDEPLTNFLDALPNPTTQDHYQRYLKYFFGFLKLEGGSLEKNSKIFVKQSRKNPAFTSSSIMNLIRFQKERIEKGEISSASISNYYKPIKLFCDMNDIPLNWKKITRTIPKVRKRGTDRIPTLDEIKKLLNYPDRRLKTAILVMMSSGIRLGAWDYLRWGDITPIRKDDKVIAAKIIVYRGEPEQYTSFITPEAYEALEGYIDFRMEHGEHVSNSSWVLRNDFDVSTNGWGSISKQLKSTGLKRLIERALWGEGIRKPLENGAKRHEFKADHGFRKYFKTMAEQHMKSLNVEILMGHSTGLADNYYRIPENDMLSEYLKAIPSLSVYQSPTTVSSETIIKIQDDMFKFKIEVLGMIKDILKNKKMSTDEIRESISKVDTRYRVVKEGIIVKDADGSETLF